jgi:hypothetical protein
VWGVLGSSKSQVGGYGIRARGVKGFKIFFFKIFWSFLEEEGITSLEGAPHGGKAKNGSVGMREKVWDHLRVRRGG